MYELGLTCAALGDAQAAIAALQAAVALKPGLAAAWLKLAELLAATGDGPGSDAAMAAHNALPADGPDQKPARKSSPGGKRDVVERQLRERLATLAPHAADRFLRDRLHQNPVDVPALRLMAEAALQRDQLDAAEALLARAIELAPDFNAARQLYAVVLFRQNREAAALPHAERIVAQDPRNIGYRTLLASILAMTGDVARSVTIYDGIVRDAPGALDIRVSHAQALKHAGRRPESVAAFRSIIARAPGTGEAWWNLANLKNEVFSDADIENMRAQLHGATLTQEGRIQLHYAMGRALEQARDYAVSFEHYAHGARLKRATISYSADETARQVRHAKALYSASLLTNAHGFAEAAPIFIIGMPRAGSTLIEQILASHSLVEGTMELPEIFNIARDLDRRSGHYPDCIATLADRDLAALGARYIDRTRIYRKSDKPIFIDKMPSNWAYAGLIHAILPNAKIIDARRGPMASCFAAFKQYLPGGTGFSYDLTELGRYYADYVDMMSHFDAAMPDRIHRVQYETLVTDTDSEIRRLLDYCQLAFEPGCLRFWETQRAVSTASSEQVRQPIFRSGLDQWSHYEPWLGPLRAALAEAGVDPSCRLPAFPAAG